MLTPASLLLWPLTITIANALSLPSPNPMVTALNVRRHCLSTTPSITLPLNDTENIIYPPGYNPGIAPFVLPIQHTPIALSCPKFIPSPSRNTTQVDSLLDLLFHQFNSQYYPLERRRPVYNGHDLFYEWSSGVGNRPGGKKPGATVSVSLQFAEGGRYDALTYGGLVIAVHGVDVIQRQWPGLDMCCFILMETGGWLPKEGLILLTSGDDQVDEQR